MTANDGVEPRKIGRPRLPSTTLEGLFEERGITRRELSDETGLSYDYIGRIMRRNAPVTWRFAGKVTMRWPGLAEGLRPFIEEDENGAG